MYMSFHRDKNIQRTNEGVGVIGRTLKNAVIPNRSCYLANTVFNNQYFQLQVTVSRSKSITQQIFILLWKHLVQQFFCFSFLVRQLLCSLIYQMLQLVCVVFHHAYHIVYNIGISESNTTAATTGQLRFYFLVSQWYLTSFDLIDFIILTVIIVIVIVIFLFLPFYYFPH